MIVLAIDPGPEESAWVLYDRRAGLVCRQRQWRSHSFGHWHNSNVLEMVATRAKHGVHDDHLAIEMIASYGMPVGAEVFNTCVWIGRFIQAWSDWGREYALVYRRDVKLHLCGQARAKDGNVRQALIDRFGGKAKAIGTKASPGALYGVSGDVWQALAVAVTWGDKRARIEANAHVECVSGETQ